MALMALGEATMHSLAADNMRCCAAASLRSNSLRAMQLSGLTPAHLSHTSAGCLRLTATVPCCVPPLVLCCAVINDVRTRGESCGGVVTCVVRGCPKGLGTPVFDKLEAELAKAMLSLPATKVRARPACAAAVCWWLVGLRLVVVAAVVVDAHAFWWGLDFLIRAHL
jgi:hypothetical protein